MESQLASVLPRGRVQAAMVAQQLGMSERSFRRRLAEEGTTFSEILDHLRNSLALRYLEDQRISLQQIGCSVIRSLPPSIMRSNGGSAHRHAVRDSGPLYLRLLSGTLNLPSHQGDRPSVCRERCSARPAGPQPAYQLFGRDYQAGVPDSAPFHRHGTETANIDIRVEPQLVNEEN